MARGTAGGNYLHQCHWLYLPGAASQINVLIPTFGNNQAATAFQFSFNYQTSPVRQLATTGMNPNLFVNVEPASTGCSGVSVVIPSGEPFAVMLNQDGSRNGF